MRRAPRLALRGLCEVSERHLGLLRALPEDDLDTVFHEPGSEALTRAEITAGLTALLRDGVGDGTLVVGESVEETATLLLNLIGWTYRHLRLGHRWSPEHAQRAVVDLAVEGKRVTTDTRFVATARELTPALSALAGRQRGTWLR